MGYMVAVCCFFIGMGGVCCVSDRFRVEENMFLMIVKQRTFTKLYGEKVV